MTLDGFSSFSFTHDGKTRTVYQRGSGPGVVVMHEVPGITPPVAAFARRVADDGFSVYVPHLFGTPGKAETLPYALASMLRCCVSREFKVLAANESSPITDWLRALCRHAHAQCGGPGVGAIGMCMTGNFALALMVDPCVMAPVLSQALAARRLEPRQARRPAPLARGSRSREAPRRRGRRCAGAALQR